MKIPVEQVVDTEILGARFKLCVVDAVRLEFEEWLVENGYMIAGRFVRCATQENYMIVPLKRPGAHGAREAVRSEPMR